MEISVVHFFFFIEFSIVNHVFMYGDFYSEYLQTFLLCIFLFMVYMSIVKLRNIYLSPFVLVLL